MGTITVMTQLINQVGQESYYYFELLSSIPSGWTPPAGISHLACCLDDWSGLWLSSFFPTVHRWCLRWSRCHIHLEQTWTLGLNGIEHVVNVSVRVGIGLIPYDLVCRWRHLLSPINPKAWQHAVTAQVCQKRLTPKRLFQIYGEFLSNVGDFTHQNQSLFTFG